MDKSWIDQPQITVWLANTVTTWKFLFSYSLSTLRGEFMDDKHSNAEHIRDLVLQFKNMQIDGNSSN